MKKLFLLIPLFLISIFSYSQVTKIKIHPKAQCVRSLSFINQDTGILTTFIDTTGYNDYFYTMYTFDGGNSWTEAVSHCNWPPYLTVSVLNPDGSGFAGGQDGVYLQTTDFGRNWTYRGHVGNFINDFQDVIFFNDTCFTMMGNRGMVFTSIDNGRNWTYFYPTPNDLNHPLKSNTFEKIDDSTALMAINGIYKTTDKGVTWTMLDIDTNRLLRSVCMLDSVNGITVGDEGTVTTFKHSAASTIYTYKSISNYDIYDIGFINDSCGIAIGGFESDLVEIKPWDTVGVIFITKDRGYTWQEHNIGNASLMELQIIGNKVYIVGTDGYFYILENIETIGIDKDPLTKKHTYSVYPNPARESIKVHCDTQINFLKTEVFDLHGRLVLTNKTFGSETSLNVHNLKPGVYILHINDCNSKQCTKIIIQ